MFCENCGSKLEDNAKFCENCGAPVAAGSEPEPEERAETYTEPVEEVVETVEDSGSYEPQSYDYSNTGYSDPMGSVQAAGPHAFSIVSMICGILSLVCCCVYGLAITFGIVAIVFGILSIVKAKGGRGMAMAGLICGGIGLLLSIIVAIVGAAAGSSLPQMLENVPGMEDVMDELDLNL